MSNPSGSALLTVLSPETFVRDWAAANNLPDKDKMSRLQQKSARRAERARSNFKIKRASLERVHGQRLASTSSGERNSEYSKHESRLRSNRKALQSSKVYCDIYHLELTKLLLEQEGPHTSFLDNAFPILDNASTKPASKYELANPHHQSSPSSSNPKSLVEVSLINKLEHLQNELSTLRQQTSFTTCDDAQAEPYSTIHNLDIPLKLDKGSSNSTESHRINSPPDPPPPDYFWSNGLVPPDPFLPNVLSLNDLKGHYATGSSAQEVKTRLLYFKENVPPTWTAAVTVQDKFFSIFLLSSECMDIC